MRKLVAVCIARSVHINAFMVIKTRVFSLPALSFFFWNRAIHSSRIQCAHTDRAACSSTLIKLVEIRNWVARLQIYLNVPGVQILTRCCHRCVKVKFTDLYPCDWKVKLLLHYRFSNYLVAFDLTRELFPDVIFLWTFKAELWLPSIFTFLISNISHSQQYRQKLWVYFSHN